MKNSVESVENAAEKKERRNIKVMDLILVIVGVSLLVFTIVMIQLFKVYGTVPDTLITCVFATLGGECGIMGWIKTTKDRNRERKWEQEDKQAEAGTIDKATKKRFVVELLEANGITVTPEIDAFIEAAVKELDLAEKNAIGEIGKIFSDTEQTPQN